MVILRDEYPPAVDLRQEMAKHPLPSVPPGIVDAEAMTPEETTKQAQSFLDTFNAALDANNTAVVANCFNTEQTYWKDILAFTYHLRTFIGHEPAVTSFLETKKLRGIPGGFKLESAQFMPVAPTLVIIDCQLSFKTSSTAATCSGRLMLLPVSINDKLEWKIWILATRLEDFDLHPENQGLLTAPGRELNGVESFETDVFIIGGGNAAVALAARLKALGVDSVMAEKSNNVGDNWALRYDHLKFHIPASTYLLPGYPHEFQFPNFLTKDALAAQLRKYVQTFNLNIITSAKIESTTFNTLTKLYTIKFSAPSLSGIRVLKATAKHLVQATGFGCHKPYLPSIPNSSLYTGISIHSAQFTNAKALEDQGVKSVAIIGSANTAFDVLESFYAHSTIPHVTLVARSPTVILPVEYAISPHSFGLYDLIPDTDAVDRIFLTLPTWPAGHFVGDSYAAMARKEPDRYESLQKTGFQVRDMAHPSVNLLHILNERGGGHYVDIGGVGVLLDGVAEGRIKVKAGVEIKEFTERGLRFQDGSVIEEADAVVWCTGFADKNGREVILDILGGKDSNSDGAPKEAGVLGAEEIAERLDDTWGVDKEGEIRGVWKRQSKGMEMNFWYMGGHTQHHRYYSKTLAQQIKAELEGILPPAYMD
ncbi:putative indole-3-pyruvate monooxygenase YUCCA4 [Cladorrhinum sp. PSN259]|nr:putative indole-3-pyruvate monooxygenase YUCCA4 [Cladorrhinum sp. PSN259]